MSPTVTALSPRKRSRVVVELDGRAWRVLPADAVVRAGLAVGRALDRTTARQLGRELRRGRAIAAATRSLVARDRSRDEIDERLERAGHSASARAAALAALDSAGLVDDTRVAESRSRELASRGFGDAAIRADLARRRVPSEQASHAIAGLEPEGERLRHYLASRAVTPALLRRLAARGFSRDSLDEAGAFAQQAGQEYDP